MTNSEQEQRDTPFNMAMLFYHGLHQVRILKTQAVLNNNISGYYDCLEEIFNTISFKISMKEEEELNKDFSEVANILKQANEGTGSTREQIMMISLDNAKDKLKKIDRKLMKLMHKYKMIFPGIESKGLKDLDKRYGLK